MATLAQMGIPGVGNGVLMPQLKNRWRVTFQGIGLNQFDSKDLSMQAVNFTKPNLTFEEVPIHRYNSTAYVAGKHVWEPTTLTVEQDITGKAASIVQAQIDAQQKLIGADGPWHAAAATGSAYKFGTKLECLDGDDLVVERWILEGCFIMTADYGDLDYAASESQLITLTIRYDHARQEIVANGLGTALGGNVA